MLKAKKKLMTTLALATVLTFQGFSVAPTVQAASLTQNTGGTTTASSSTTSTITINSYSDLVNAITNTVMKQNTNLTFSMPASVYSSMQGSWFDRAYHDVIESAGNDYQKHCVKDYSGYTSKNPDGSYKGIFIFEYAETTAQSALVKTKVDQILSQIITPGMTDEQKEKAICVWIYNHVSYDKSLTHYDAYNAVLGTGTTVCQGFELLTYLMLTDAGLQARCVIGTTIGGGHAWNQVKINGNWYNLDNTGDQLNQQVGDYDFTFFNLQDTQLEATGHYWTASYYNKANTPYVTNDGQISNNGRPSDVDTALPNNAQAITTTFRGLDVSLIVGGLSTSDSLIITSASGANIQTINANASGIAYTWVPRSYRDDGYVNVAIKHNGITGPTTKVKFIPCSEFPFGAVTATTATSTTAKVTIASSKFNAGDVVKIYATSGTFPSITTPLDYSPIASAGVGGSSNIILTVPDTTGSIFYATVTSVGKAESSKFAIPIVQTPAVQAPINNPGVTPTPLASNFLVVNPTSGSATVVCTNLLNGDVVKVYNKSGTTILGQVKAILPNDSTASKYAIYDNLTLPLTQSDGAVLVSVTRNNLAESSKVLVSFKTH